MIALYLITILLISGSGNPMAPDKAPKQEPPLARMPPPDSDAARYRELIFDQNKQAIISHNSNRNKKYTLEVNDFASYD